MHLFQSILCVPDRQLPLPMLPKGEPSKGIFIAGMGDHPRHQIQTQNLKERKASGVYLLQFVPITDVDIETQRGKEIYLWSHCQLLTTVFPTNQSDHQPLQALLFRRWVSRNDYFLTTISLASTRNLIGVPSRETTQHNDFREQYRILYLKVIKRIDL